MEDKEERAEPLLKEILAHIDALDGEMKTYARGCLRQSILSSSGNIVSSVQCCSKVFILGRKNITETLPREMPQFFFGGFLTRAIVPWWERGAMKQRLLVQEALRASENPRRSIGRGASKRLNSMTSGRRLSDSSAGSCKQRFFADSRRPLA
jgi:hypothetical protein